VSLLAAPIKCKEAYPPSEKNVEIMGFPKLLKDISGRLPAAGYVDAIRCFRYDELGKGA
jgi:hypothetical protein